MNFGQEIHAALLHLERAQEASSQAGAGKGHLARLVIADRQLRAILDEEGRRLARLAALAADKGLCERGTYVNA